ncbi:MAG TPA: hypothetical protein VJ724_14150 [Tahibacter sp.]|nr:hypothetical protein [Tahibacter sp.]
MSDTFPGFSALALGHDDAGHLQLVCVGTDHHVYLAAMQGAGEGNDWTVPKTNALALQKHKYTDVVLGSGNARMLQVVGLGTDGHAYLAAYLGLDGDWHEPKGVPSPLAYGRYAAMATANGYQDSLWVIGLSRDDKHIYIVTEQNSRGVWIGTDIPLGKPVRTYSTFALAHGDGDDLLVLALGENDRLLYLVAYQSAAKGGWQAGPDDPIGGPNGQYQALTAAKAYDGKLRAVALGTDRKVYQAAYQADGDGTWQVTSLPLGDPNAVYADLRLGHGPDGSLHAICLGTDGAIYLAASFEKTDGRWHAGDAAINPLGGRGDRRYRTYALGAGAAASLQVVALEAEPQAGSPYLAAWLDGGLWRNGRSLAQGDPARWNPRLRDVKGAFDAVPEHGKNHVFFDNPNLPVGHSHIQGVAQYGGYFLLTYSRPPNDFETGSMLLYSADDGYRRSFDTPVPGYPHPGGCQAIGDYLVLPVEQGSSSWVCFAYIGALGGDRAPTILSTRIRREASGSGAAGITDVGSGPGRYYVVGVYDGGAVTMYRSNGHALDNENCAFAELFTGRPGGRGADNLCLLTGADGSVYLVGFTSTGGASTDDEAPKQDWVELYLVDFANERFVLQKERQMYTDADFLFNDVHFRWGAGLSIVSDRRLRFYCTDRNVYPIMQINTFGR